MNGEGRWILFTLLFGVLGGAIAVGVVYLTRPSDLIGGILGIVGALAGMSLAFVLREWIER